MTLHRTITGGGGTALHLASIGPEDAPPILMVHGFLHSFLCWSRQFAGPLVQNFRLHALDMRGHGMSDKPEAPEAYMDGALWAVDMAAAIEACGRPPVVVVWSYPGLLLGDYLRRHGGSAVAGVVLVAALTGIGLRRPPTRPDSTSPLFASELERALPALRDFVARCTAGPVPGDELALMTATAAMVPPRARLGLNMRRDDFLPDYVAAGLPTRVIWGMQDAIVARAEAEDAAAAIPGAQLSLYDEVGHMPFFEAPARFDAELAAFARAAHGVAA